MMRNTGGSTPLGSPLDREVEVVVAVEVGEGEMGKEREWEQQQERGWQPAQMLPEKEEQRDIENMGQWRVLTEQAVGSNTAAVAAAVVALLVAAAVVDIWTIVELCSNTLGYT